MQAAQYKSDMPNLGFNLEAKSILIVEDDPDIANLIQLHLQDIYKQVEIAKDGLIGYNMANSKQWDLILLDLRLPGKDGIELCRDLRAEQNHTPILMLTSKSGEMDRVLGLEIGADDYVTKPFSIIELTARIKAIFRRLARTESLKSTENTPKKTNNLSCSTHELELDTQLFQVKKSGSIIELTAKEFDLLNYFLQSPGQVFSRAHLLNKIWGHGHDGYEHTVNSHINRLRGKIEEKPTEPNIITTVWGIGYKLNAPTK